MKVIVLQSEKEKSQGLQGVKKLPDDHVVLFKNVVPGQSFHTRGCLFTMDIIPLSSDGMILSIFRSPPGIKAIHMPLGTSHVLETNQDWCKRNRLQIGSSLFSYLGL